MKRFYCEEWMNPGSLASDLASQEVQPLARLREYSAGHRPANTNLSIRISAPESCRYIKVIKPDFHCNSNVELS